MLKEWATFKRLYLEQETRKVCLACVCSNTLCLLRLYLKSVKQVIIVDKIRQVKMLTSTTDRVLSHECFNWTSICIESLEELLLEAPLLLLLSLAIQHQQQQLVTSLCIIWPVHFRVLVIAFFTASRDLEVKVKEEGVRRFHLEFFGLPRISCP